MMEKKMKNASVKESSLTHNGSSASTKKNVEVPTGIT